MSANSVLRSNGWPFNSRVFAFATAFGLGSALLYLIYRRRKSIRTDANSPAILQEVESIKAYGVEAFRRKKFDEAVLLFGNAIEELNRIITEFSGQVDEKKIEELKASCENNKAACYDELGNIDKCLVHCDFALQIKPNYEKAIRRRARCNLKLGHKDIALNDYFDLIFLENVSKESLSAYHTELDRVIDDIIVPQLNEFVQNRIGQPLKIPQMIVNEWMYGTVTNDPLLTRMEKMMDVLNRDEAHWVSPLDDLLFALKRGDYEGIASLAMPIIDNETNDLVDRLLAVLLAARFLFYQTLNARAAELMQKFDNFWDKFDEVQKLAHKDIQVAFIALQLTTVDLTSKNVMSTEGNFKIDENVKQHCLQLVEEGLRIDPKNVDPLVTFGVQLLNANQFEDALSIFLKAKNIDKHNNFVRFYEINARLELDIRQQAFSDMQTQMFMLQQILLDGEGVPTFAFMVLSKFALFFQNKELAIEACKKALEKMPNCSDAIYLLALVEFNERDSILAPELECAMRKAIEVDPNYSDPYKIMGRICLEKKSFAEALDFFSKAISLARKREELMLLFREQLMTNVFAKRSEQGKNLSTGMAIK